MSVDYDDDMGVIDMTDSLIVNTDDDGGVISITGGNFPVNGRGDPYRFGVKCKHANGSIVLVRTDMDYQTLVID